MVFFTKFSVLMLKLVGRLEVGDWLSVSLIRFSHGHVFNTKADGGTVKHQPPEKGKKIMWGPIMGKREG